MTLESILTFLTVFGATAFVVKMVLLFVGSGDMDSDIHDHSDDFEDEATKSFLTLSTQTIFAAMMIGGLFGLSAFYSESSELYTILSVLVGAVIGGATSSFTMSQIKRLNYTPVKRQPNVGDEGVAYLPMEDLRVGQVMLKIDGREELFEAYSKNGLIRAFEAVKVVDNRNNRLIVESLTK